MPVMDGYEFLGNLRRMPGGMRPGGVLHHRKRCRSHRAFALHAGANNTS